MSRKHTLKEMISIQSEFERKFASSPGIVGVGIGKDNNTGDYALRVFVQNRNASRRLPTSFHDVVVSIDVTGDLTAY
jgi:hypothetical protein